ncbi:MAG: prolyl-tRNA synthetase associated domain-containing protein [bacterium]|nr:prolyl-tRNA synthetase associated domain-containing protein [bacterium]
MPITRNQLFDFLDKLQISHKTVKHDAAHTVEQAQANRGMVPGGHAKNLFLKCKKGSLWLVVVQEDTPIHLNRLHKLLGCGRLSFGSPELMKEVLGISPGSVTPFALINDKTQRISLVLDEQMMKEEMLNFHPLDNRATTTISRDGLLQFIKECGFTPKILKLPLNSP